MRRCSATRRTWGATAVSAVFLLLFAGCGRQPPPQPDVVSDTVERGPLKLTVEAKPRDARVGDIVDLTLRVETPAEYEVAFPEAKDLGELGARDVASPTSQPGATGVVWRRSFRIEPLVSGSLEIPPLTVKYGKRATGATTQSVLENELVSGGLKLEVRSTLTAQDKPVQPRDITGTLLPPKPPWSLWMWGAVIGGVVVVLAAGWGVGCLIWRRMTCPPAPILPEVWALRALAELEYVDWFDQERVREFYYRLTEIVRRYIEMKFGLAAPEMTTEEFLVTLSRDQRALPYDAERLRVFLEACDYVKYAALNPQRADAESVLQTARAFVNATAAAASAREAETAPAAGGQAA